MRFESLLIASCLVLTACGGDDSAPTDATTDTSTTIDSTVDSATDSAADAVADTSADAPDCSGAMEGEPCSAEGTVCGGPCTDACSFCNLLRCDGGTWSRMEVFPAPCFECGGGVSCQTDVQYCMHTISGEMGGEDTYECTDPPGACSDDLTCDCLTTAGVTGDCSAGEPGEVTVTIAAP
jgi:hypothetical protein